jgi:lycopene beta-cyclase
MTQNHPTPCDYLFAGAGASATLLMMRMEKMGLLTGKKIVVVDPDFDALSRKTFCFWAAPGDEIMKDCQALIQKSWKNLRIDRGRVKPLHPLQYHCITGENMQQAMHTLLERNQCHLVKSTVISLVSDDRGVLVSTPEGTFRSGQVFDSRPSGFMSPKPNESALFQSFVGYVVETHNPILQLDAMDMMDFDVEQQGATQFMYVLPFTNNKALVELTRFGLKKIADEEAEPVLQSYIKQHFGEVRITATERGCIPMCSAPLQVRDIAGVTRIGGRAGAVKPGTGYAFKNMHSQAVAITTQLLSGEKPLLKQPSRRFRFYDRLLLWILSNKPELGKTIFRQLFQRNSTPYILNFLDEKTSLIRDTSILLSLPFRPFLTALRQDLKYNAPPVTKPLILTVFALLLWFVYAVSPALYMPLQWLLLSLGLLFVGIPHGAVDHLLDTGKLQAGVRPAFVVKYVGIMLLYLLLWQALPTLALAVFLLYSAFHFGQSDIQEWQITRYSNLKSLLWGIIILGIILLSHFDETIAIIKGMGVAFTGINLGETRIYVMLLAALLWALIEKKMVIIWSLLMLMISTQLPLAAAFGLYFIGQHSLNGWSHLQKGMGAAGSTLFRKALPFTLGALILLGLLMLFVYTGMLPWTNKQWISIFFVFLACLSLPHVWAMHRFYNRSVE